MNADPHLLPTGERSNCNTGGPSGECTVCHQIPGTLIVVGNATTWRPSAALRNEVLAMVGRVRARAKGVALPAEHTCNQDGPVKTQGIDGPEFPTCSICGELQR